MLDKMSCKKCCDSYQEYKACIDAIVHGPAGNQLQLWKRRGETSFSSPSTQNLLYLNDKIDSLGGSLVKYMYEFIHEVKESVVLRLLSEQISMQSFLEVVNKMFVGRVLCDLDYNNIINQCAFIICNLVDKVNDSLDMFIRIHETMFHALAQGDIIHNLCAGPNIEGNVFKKCYEVILKRNVRIIAIDINSWDYGFDKCERVVKEVVESDIIDTNMMFHGIKYLDWLSSKSEEEMVRFLGKKVIFSVEHFSVARQSNLCFYQFVGEPSVSKGVMCCWRGHYVFAFMRMQAYRKYHITVLIDSATTCEPYFSKVDAICYCEEVDHNCRYNAVVHDIICMQEAAIDGCEFDEIKDWYIMKHREASPYIDIDSEQASTTVLRHRLCPLECVTDYGHYNDYFLLRGKVHEHLSCVYLGYKCNDDADFYERIREILKGDLTNRKSDKCNVFSTANRIKQAPYERYLPIPRLSWAKTVDFYDDDLNAEANVTTSVIKKRKKEVYIPGISPLPPSVATTNNDRINNSDCARTREYNNNNNNNNRSAHPPIISSDPPVMPKLIMIRKKKKVSDGIRRTRIKPAERNTVTTSVSLNNRSVVFNRDKNKK